MFNLTMIWFMLIPLALAGGSAIYFKNHGWKYSAISSSSILAGIAFGSYVSANNHV
jgi:hypothetical protein